VIVGVGVDVVEIARVRRILAGKGGDFLARVLTPGERAYCESKVMPEPHVAARIAAKEAAFKALSGTDQARGIGWRELEVVLDGHGRPSMRLHGRAGDRAAELGVTDTWVSLTHSGNVAAAVVVLEVRAAA
jgi:holo-[acyl-carrier protein] synthase